MVEQGMGKGHGLMYISGKLREALVGNLAKADKENKDKHSCQGVKQMTPMKQPNHEINFKAMMYLCLETSPLRPPLQGLWQTEESPVQGQST